MTRRPLWPGILLGLLIPGMIYAANAVVPYRFQAGGLIRADEMNANFDSLRDAINAGQNGTRLRVLRAVSPDGLNTAVTLNSSGLPLLWDAQLSMTCLPLLGRCGPMITAQNFSDSSCTQRVAIGTASQYQFSSAAAIYGFDAGVSETTAFAYSVDSSRTITYYRVGARQNGLAYSTQSLVDGGVTCIAAQSTYDYFPVTGTEPATTFVPLALTVN